MAFEPLRFIHAAHVCLGRLLDPPREPSAEIREIVEEATFTSFRRLVDDCLESDVEFLLLVGNTFCVDGPDLRAEVELRRGLERLQQRQVRVFVRPGSREESAAWRAIVELPENVTLFANAEDEPLAVLRGENVIATVTAAPSATFLRSRSPAENQPHSPFRIGVTTDDSSALAETVASLQRRPDDSDPSFDGPATTSALSVDYLALSGSSRRKILQGEKGMIHDPGKSVGLSCDAVGPHGCTLVEIDAEKSVQCTFLPTAPVRWERFVVHIDEDSEREPFLKRMQRDLSNSPPSANEDVRCVKWSVRGHGRLFELMQQDEFQSQLTQRLAAEVFPDCHVRVLCNFDFFDDGQDVTTNVTTNGTTNVTTDDNALRLDVDYFLRLHDEVEISAGRFPETEMPPAWARRLQSLVNDTGRDAVLHQARRLGRRWLNQQHCRKN